MRLIKTISALAALAALAACHGNTMADDSCAPGQPYLTATSVAPIKPAEGLPAANTKNALKIPDMTAEPKPGGSKATCLDAPPSFVPDRPRPGSSK